MVKKTILIFTLLLIIFGVIFYSISNSVPYRVLEEQIAHLKENDKLLLKQNKVIILNNLEELQVFGDSRLSNIIISEELVKNPVDRYCISHYIRNRLVKDIKQYCANGEVIRPEFVHFDNYERYIKNHSKEICNVIYFLGSKYHFDLQQKIGYQFDVLFEDHLLGQEMINLKNKLISEGSYIDIFSVEEDVFEI